jgi:hypothetical protein
VILKAHIDDKLYELLVPDALLAEAQDFFARMDADMGEGIQMNRDWIASPSLEQRCQLVADKLLTALENENHNLGRLMAGYILTRLPNLAQVTIDTQGNLEATEFHFQAH